MLPFLVAQIVRTVTDCYGLTRTDTTLMLDRTRLAYTLCKHDCRALSIQGTNHSVVFTFLVGNTKKMVKLQCPPALDDTHLHGDDDDDGAEPEWVTTHTRANLS